MPLYNHTGARRMVSTHHKLNLNPVQKILDFDIELYFQVVKDIDILIDRMDLGFYSPVTNICLQTKFLTQMSNSFQSYKYNHTNEINQSMYASKKCLTQHSSEP